MIQVMLTFPKYTSPKIPGRDQILIERLSARLYRAEKRKAGSAKIRKDIFLTKRGTGQLETMTENDADLLKDAIEDNSMFDLDLRDKAFSLSYVCQAGNPANNERDKTLVLRFSLDQLPNKDYINDYCHLVTRKRRNNDRRWVRSIPPIP